MAFYTGALNAIKTHVSPLLKATQSEVRDSWGMGAAQLNAAGRNAGLGGKARKFMGAKSAVGAGAVVGGGIGAVSQDDGFVTGGLKGAVGGAGLVGGGIVGAGLAGRKGGRIASAVKNMNKPAFNGGLF